MHEAVGKNGPSTWEAPFLSKFYYSLFPVSERENIHKVNINLVTEYRWEEKFSAFLIENNFSYFFLIQNIEILSIYITKLLNLIKLVNEPRNRDIYEEIDYKKKIIIHLTDICNSTLTEIIFDVSRVAPYPIPLTK
jgi:hypothetical protein